MGLPRLSCWHPVSMGAAIDNDDGAITIMPLGVPVMKTIPITVMMIVMIVPHVVVVGRALIPMVLVVVGFQLLMQVNGQPPNAYMPNNFVFMMIIMIN